MLNHYLASYQQALLAICLAQFSSKRYRTGMRGVLSLAETSGPLARLFQQELGLSIPDMIELSRYARQMTCAGGRMSAKGFSGSLSVQSH